MKAPLNLERKTLSDTLYDHILEYIQNESLKPGDKLPSENSLAELFGVSRPIVREALTRLKSLGLIEVHSGRVSAVRQVDSYLPALFFQHSIAMKTHNIAELLQVRRGLEMESSSLAALNAEPSDLRIFESILVGMSDTLAKGDIPGYIEHDVEFHLAIAKASKNSMLLNLIHAIREPLRETIDGGLKRQDSEFEIRRLHRIHKDIVDAITSKDSKASSAAMERHFNIALNSIIRGDEI